MLTRDGAGRILRARWPPLVALTATLAYAVVVIGFGLDFRPLHNDEGVTLGVASRASALDVLRVAVDHRHGPPLHYLLVHAALAWRLRHPGAAAALGAARDRRGGDQLRLRPRAGRPGRRSGGRGRHRLLADHDPPGPVRPRLHRDDRGGVRQRLAHARAPAHRPRPLGDAVRRRDAPARVGPPVRAVRAPVRARPLRPVRGGQAPRTGSPASAGWRRRWVPRSCWEASPSCSCATCTHPCRASTASARGRRS